MQHDSTCQPLMYGHVSALKPYVITRFEFRLAKLPVGADAVSSLQSKSKSRGKGRAKRWQKFAQPMDRYKGVLWVLLQVTALKTKVCCLLSPCL